MCVCAYFVVCVQMSGVYGVMCVFMFGCGCSAVCDGLCVCCGVVRVMRWCVYVMHVYGAARCVCL